MKAKGKLFYILRHLKGLEDELIQCMRCGMCQAVCPLYGETGIEADVARGKLSLVDGLLKRFLDDPKALKRRLDRCLLCGSCEANCPSGVKVVEIFLKAKVIIGLFGGLSYLERIILRGILSHPKVFDGMFGLFRRLFPLTFKDASSFLGTSCSRVPLPIVKDRHIKITSDFAHEKDIMPLSISTKRLYRVAVFVGCVIDKIYPSVKTATINVLRYHGCDVIVPEHQGCCGIPALSGGDIKSFGQLIKWNLDIFKNLNYDYIVCACPTCTWTIKYLWPLFKEYVYELKEEDFISLSSKIIDVNEFIVTKLNYIEQNKNDDLRDSIVTYHDPCHLRKSLGIWKEPRMLVKTNKEMQFVEMPYADMCCGMGGSFNLRYYSLSSAIGQKKRAFIKSTGASILTTACPACMFQLHDVLSKNGDKIQILHTVELYLKVLKSSALTS